MLKKWMVLPVVAAVLAAAPALACADNPNCGGVCSSKVEAAPAKAVKGEAVTEEFAVEGMKCQNCANGVTNALQKLEGVSVVKVDLKSKTAKVTYAKGAVNLEGMNKALKGHFKLAAKGAAPQAATPAKPAAEHCTDEHHGEHQHGEHHGDHH